MSASDLAEEHKREYSSNIRYETDVLGGQMSRSLAFTKSAALGPWEISTHVPYAELDKRLQAETRLTLERTLLRSQQLVGGADRP